MAAAIIVSTQADESRLFVLKQYEKVIATEKSLKKC